jgi:precorrin-6B C5,15-methyltransferase / cobalt-precorrin-6B C5,C15-methyltransferase
MSEVASPPEADAGGAPSEAPVVLVGIGHDGWEGLAPTSCAEIQRADVLMGSPHHLDMVPADVTAQRVPWPAPTVETLPELFDEYAGRAVVVLAPGDPMYSSVGAALTRVLGYERVRVLPGPSAVSLACARLGWSVEDIEVVSVVGRPLALLHPLVQPGRRLLVLGSDDDTAAQVAALLRPADTGRA